jgi:ATP-dependent exoDNAse (exonuclease V) beta subunit
MKNVKIDKQNGDVAFVDSTHTYFNIKNPDVKYISVTTLIDKYAQPFDKDFWSSYKALEQIMPKDLWKTEKKSLLSAHVVPEGFLLANDVDEKEFQKVKQEILDQWEETNREACERGTKIHSELEHQFYKGGDNVDLKKFGIGGKFSCKKDYSELDLENGVYPEYLIYRDSNDGILHIAGQVDLIVKNGNNIFIIDHKTNKKIDTKGFYNSVTKTTSKMKYPLNNLDDINFNHYQLQLSTYAWMLQKIHPEFNIKGLIINHYDHDGNNTLYHCEYLKKEVEKMLLHYRKQLIHEQQEDKYKQIEY